MDNTEKREIKEENKANVDVIQEPLNRPIESAPINKPIEVEPLNKPLKNGYHQNEENNKIKDLEPLNKPITENQALSFKEEQKDDKSNKSIQKIEEDSKNLAQNSLNQNSISIEPLQPGDDTENRKHMINSSKKIIENSLLESSFKALDPN